jgi:hypothetical protein
MLPLIAVLLCADGTVTLPLEQVLPMYQREAASQPAVIVKSTMGARPTVDRLQVDARIDIVVLEEGKYVRVPLFKMSPNLSLSQATVLDDAAVGVVAGEVVFITKKAGNYSVELALTLRATGSGKQRQARLQPANEGVRAPMKITADASLFTLAGDDTVFPDNDGWTISWNNLAAEQKQKASAAPPIDPRIASADATWVTTLEGKARLRARYSLVLDRKERITFALPEGHKLERVTVNGVQMQSLELEVAPATIGAREATIEIETSRDLGVFHLAGKIRLALPQVSWPIAELSAHAYLPAVFNYRREGGSMEDGAAASLETLPGKPMHFRQYLITASAPTVEIAYSVDIEKSYFQ